MYQNIFKFVIIFLGVLLQASFFPNLVQFTGFPDVALVIVLFWTATRGFDDSWKWAVLAGLLVDLTYFWPIGASIFSFTAAAYLVNSLTKRFLVQQTFFRFLILAGIISFGAGVSEVLSSLIVGLVGKNVMDFRFLDFTVNTSLKIIYNFAIFSAIYLPLVRLEKFFQSWPVRFRTIG